MLLYSLLLIPIVGVLVNFVIKEFELGLTYIKSSALITSILNLSVSLVIFILFDFSTNQFQFVQEFHKISHFDLYLGVDGLSIYFILLTTIIMPVSLLSNWTSISKDVESYVIIILSLEVLLLTVFLALDILLFYIFFESILPPLFILIGIFGSDNRVKASFYLFLYTLLGSLFLLLSILAMSSIMSTTDFDTLFKGNFIYLTQLFLFYGIFIAFAVKTPTIFLNTWLLKAHVESPLGGSIILAAIVLKLSLYGILRLILPVLPKAYMEYTYIIYLIGVITIIYASLSTLRTIDVKELIAYSSVSHAAVYLLGVFSNSIQGIEGAISLGLAHGLVSPGLFICAGGVLYDRSHTRIIAFYRGMAQIMPLFAILFFILCLANCGAPLSLNFIGEFMSLYGVFEASSLFGFFASISIVLSAGYTMLMYQNISFAGSYSTMFTINVPDVNKREFIILLTLVVPTVIFGIYPAPILDGIHYGVSTLIYCFDSSAISCDAPKALNNLTDYCTSISYSDMVAFPHFDITLIQFAFVCFLFAFVYNTLPRLYLYKIYAKDIFSWRISGNNLPRPHPFEGELLLSSPFDSTNTQKGTEKLDANDCGGISPDWEKTRHIMPASEQIYHIDQFISYCNDKLSSATGNANAWYSRAKGRAMLEMHQLHNLSIKTDMHYIPTEIELSMIRQTAAAHYGRLINRPDLMALEVISLEMLNPNRKQYVTAKYLEQSAMSKAPFKREMSPESLLQNDVIPQPALENGALPQSHVNAIWEKSLYHKREVDKCLEFMEKEYPTYEYMQRMSKKVDKHHMIANEYTDQIITKAPRLNTPNDDSIQKLVRDAHPDWNKSRVPESISGKVSQAQSNRAQMQQKGNVTSSPYIPNLELSVFATLPSMHLFIRNMITFLRPLFRVIVSLGLVALVLDYTPLIIEVYTMLATLVGEYIMWSIKVLFSVLLFLVRLVLMIRKANISVGKYDKFFTFVYNNLGSILLYFCIFLLSVGLVYCCGCDCNNDCGCLFETCTAALVDGVH